MDFEPFGNTRIQSLRAQRSNPLLSIESDRHGAQRLAMTGLCKPTGAPARAPGICKTAWPCRCASVAVGWLLALAGLLLPAAASAITLWPTIPFIRGQDLCQYQDAYGRSRSASRKEMILQVSQLMAMGAETPDAVQAIVTIDKLITQQRQLARIGAGMDVTLESVIKASLDQTYREVQPRERKLTFFNPTTLIELLDELKEQHRQERVDANHLARLSGMAWGTYAYGPSCNNDILLTLHVTLHSGQTYNFSARGEPESAAMAVASKMFQQFQATQFPSVIQVNGKSLTLVGAPGSPVSHAPTPALAEKACASVKARLPSWEEYEMLAMLGDWNGGVSLNRDVWTLSGGKVLSPNLRNPSPVRQPEEARGEDLHFYCVR